MKIETLSERIANAENKIGKKQITIAKKQAMIAKKQQLLETKYLVNSDSLEALTLKWDIEHYTDDISRLEREINETTLSLAEYRKQLTGLMERVSVLITDMPDILKGLKEELVERWDKWDIERRDRIQSDYRELDYKEFSRKYTHADVMFKGKSDEQIHDDNVQSAENLIIDLIYRVRKITGEITDWSNICASAGTGGFTVLNGTVIGKEGIACVESITAGGYNIQRLHIRVLVYSV
ncbi:MAG: hypothetical protein IIT39_10935 [Clostridia bacterium]|nr:hypothetical protein [Clostridia bacterium]